MIDFKIFFLTGFIPYILKKIMGKLLQLFGTQGNLNPRLNTFKKQLFHDGGRYHIETNGLRKSMDWFLYDNGLRYERVKSFHCVSY